MASVVQRAGLSVDGSVVRASRLVAAEAPVPAQGWCLKAVAGRFIELTGTAQSAVLTAAVGLVLEAQRGGRFAAWITGPGSCVYPPDLDASGVDLAALPVVRAPDARGAARAADCLVRSKGFAVVVMDVGTMARFSLSMQTRLLGLAQNTGTALICLTGKSKGRSLVSLRGETTKVRVGPDCFRCAVSAVKDKRGQPGWTHEEVCHGTDGLC